MPPHESERPRDETPRSIAMGAVFGVASSFFSRVANRLQPEDVAALVAEDCVTEFLCRRALYAGVDERDGSLAVRFTIDFDRVRRTRFPLSANGDPLVRTALEGSVRSFDANQLLASGLRDDALGDKPLEHVAVIPLVSPPLPSGPKGVLQPLCRLYKPGAARGEECWQQDVSAPDEEPPIPVQPVRIRTLCPACPALGLLGIIVAERHAPFMTVELGRLALVGQLAGQRIRALETLVRQQRPAEKLAKEREWLDTIMVAAADPIVVTDLTNALVIQNRRAEDLLVARPDDSAGKRRAISINDITFSAYLSSVEIDARRAPRELPLVHPIDGSDLLFEAITTPAFGASGQRIGAVTVLRDITDLQKATTELRHLVAKAQKAEASIRQERDRLTLILRGAVDPIVVTDQANDVILANSEGELLFQVGPVDSQKRRRAVRHNDTYFSSFLTEFLADPDPHRKRTIGLVDPVSEEVRSFELAASKVQDERSRTVTVVSVFHDVTKMQELERRRLEQKLFDSEKLAATGRLAASIAHELNNPLAAIVNSLYILKAKVGSDLEAATFADIAERECDRVSRIVKQFLGLHRPAVSKTSVDLDALIEDELKLVDSQLRRRRITVERRLSGAPRVLASEDQIKQVFLNLLLNAIEAMPKGGTLGVATRLDRREEMVVVRASVSDSGPGIASEHLPHLFEPFFTTKSEKGTGLGLWVSYGIVKGHRGTIDVETAAGSGTTFHVLLPVGMEAEVAHESAGGSEDHR